MSSALDKYFVLPLHTAVGELQVGHIIDGFDSITVLNTEPDEIIQVGPRSIGVLLNERISCREPCGCDDSWRSKAASALAKITPRVSRQRVNTAKFDIPRLELFEHEFEKKDFERAVAISPSVQRQLKWPNGVAYMVTGIATCASYSYDISHIHQLDFNRDTRARQSGNGVRVVPQTHRHRVARNSATSVSNCVLAARLTRLEYSQEFGRAGAGFLQAEEFTAGALKDTRTEWVVSDMSASSSDNGVDESCNDGKHENGVSTDEKFADGKTQDEKRGMLG